MDSQFHTIYWEIKYYPIFFAWWNMSTLKVWLYIINNTAIILTLCDTYHATFIAEFSPMRFFYGSYGGFHQPSRCLYLRSCINLQLQMIDNKDLWFRCRKYESLEEVSSQSIKRWMFKCKKYGNEMSVPIHVTIISH